MSSDVAEVEKVLQVYFDGLYEGDTAKLGQAFHPASHLYSAQPDGTAADMPRADWFKMVEGRKSAKASGSERRDRSHVHQIHREGGCKALNPRISRRRQERAHLRVLGQTGNQGVLARAAAENKNSH